MWPTTMPQPYAKNARVCPEPAIGKVAASIKEFGFRSPLIVDKAGVIIAGHTRLLAAQRLGLDEVPVIVCADLSDARAKALRLADNRTAQETSWDYALLNAELEDLVSDGFDVSLTGFDPDELCGVNFTPIGEDDTRRLDQRKPVTCPECGHEFTV
jgi:ParB family transcriptional regulator, chromosome partitioning protein